MKINHPGIEVKLTNKKVFLSHSFIYLLGIIFSHAASFVLIPIYTRYIAPSEFGILELINICIEVISIICSCGLGIATLSLYSEAIDINKKKLVISTAVYLSLLCGFSATVCVYALSDVLCQYFFSTSEYSGLVRLAGFLMCAQLVLAVPMAYIQASMRSKLYVGAGALQSVVIICINIVTVVVLNQGIGGIILGNLIGTSIFSVLLITFTLLKTGVRLNVETCRSIIRFGLPFVPGGLFLFTMNSADRFFIQKLLDSSTLGIYSIGYKMGTLVGVFVLGPFLRVWGPYMFEVSKDCSGNQSFGQYFSNLILVYSIFGLGLSIFSKEIISIIAGNSYSEGSKIIPYIILAFLFWSAAAVFDSGFYITKKTYYKPFIMGFAASLIFFLYWQLIPIYGLMGGAYATTICYGIYSIITYLISHRIYAVEYSLKRATIIMCLGIFFYSTSTLIPEKNSIMSLTGKAVLVMLYPLVLFFGNIIDKTTHETIINHYDNFKISLLNVYYSARSSVK